MAAITKIHKNVIYEENIEFRDMVLIRDPPKSGANRFINITYN